MTLTPKEFNALRVEFLNGNSTGRVRLLIIQQLNQYQRAAVRKQDSEAKNEAALLVGRASAQGAS
jgi:hypothetical protein